MAHDRGKVCSASTGIEGVSTGKSAFAALVEEWLYVQTGQIRPVTIQGYTTRMRLFLRHADTQGWTPSEFKGRHLAHYLAARAQDGVTEGTRHYDALIVTLFFRWAAREGIIRPNPLADYRVPKLPKPHVRCPTDTEVNQLLAAVEDRWMPSKNHQARFTDPKLRMFYRRRNVAIVLGLARTALRAGEMLSLTVDDVNLSRLEVTVREAKGKAPRTVPITADWAAAVAAWLRERPVASASPALFVTVYGGSVDTRDLAHQIKGYATYAGVSWLNMHKLRHYALTFLAKQSPLLACAVAGHKNIRTTMGYLHTDADYLREEYDRAMRGSKIIVNARSERQKKMRLV